jgi:ATP-dependent helicase/nuclease subunit B
VNAILIRPGAQSVDWLLATIAELKGGDPLAPVTVVVPSNHVGLAVRRDLARRGYANVRFGVMGHLVEPLGAPPLAAAGRTPLTTPSEEAAVREAVYRSGDAFGDVREHPALIRTLRDLFRELRAAVLDRQHLDDLRPWGRMADVAVSVFAEWRSVVESSNLYDDEDLVVSATVALARPEAVRLMSEIGAVVLYLPAGVRPSEARFLVELSKRCPIRVALSWFGDVLADAPSRRIAEQLGVETASATTALEPSVRLVAVSDAAEEVRSAVRNLLSRVEQGAELGRVAMVYANADPYGPMLRDTLDSANVAWAGIDGRPLSESWSGRGLLGLLRLRERDFARVDVLAWLGSLPESDPGGVSIGDWDRLSRTAAVVKGAKQWKERLGLQALEARNEADGMEKDGRSEGAIRFRRYEARAMDRMADFIKQAEAQTLRPADQSWSGYAAWAEAIRRHFIPSGAEWPEREREADDMIAQQLVQLGAATAVEAGTTIERFVEACAAALENRRQTEGRLGSGVAVGPISSLFGLSFDFVHILGAAEQALPHPDPPDPVFPPDGGPDPLGRVERRRSEQRRVFLAAVAAGKEVRLSFPAWDADLRPSYPSPWSIELAKSSDGAVKATDLRFGAGATNVEAIPSPEAALRVVPALINVAEWRVACARREGANLPHAGLAKREDLPLGRHLEVRRARQSDNFTEFDGNVETEVRSLQALSEGLAFKAQSPSTIEGWATCPFRYLLERLVEVDPTERPEQDVAWSIGAAAKGSLLHGILSRFFTERRDAHGTGRYGADDFRRIEEIAHEEFSKVERSGTTGHQLAWENEKHAMLADLRTLLRKDEELFADGLRPALFEQAFGMGNAGWDALVLDLGAGRSAKLRGRIDRIDLGPDPSEPEAARLIDYKTGSAFNYKESEFAKDPVVAGTKVQPSVYAAAVRSQFADIRISSGYWFASAKGGFNFLHVADDEARLREVLGVMDRGLRSGAFPQVPGDERADPERTGWINCFYCPFDRICPTGRDRMRERKRDRPGPLIHLQLRKSDGS